MTNSTPSHETTTVRPSGVRSLSALRATLRARHEQLSERRATALAIGAYPATRSAAVVVLPAAARQAA
jgi:hypothetical protein